MFQKTQLNFNSFTFKSLNQGLIDESEIGQAILFADLKENCNPYKHSSSSIAATNEPIKVITTHITDTTDNTDEMVGRKKKSASAVTTKKPKLEPICLDEPIQVTVQQPIDQIIQANATKATNSNKE